MIIDYWLILLLAVVQGFTEFLPVSSSGHLVLFESFFGVRGAGGEGGILFEISVHVGTLAAVLLVYRRRLGGLISGALRFISSRFGDGLDDVRYIGYMAVASVPAAVVGLLFRDEIEILFDSPRVTALLLIVTALVLTASRIRGQERELTVATAFLVGVAQAIAILPGCSRSGWTITVGLLLGLGFGRAAEFSFLISIPAILGALVLEIWKHPAAASREEIMTLLIGGLVAFLSGWLALRLLLRILRTGAFHRFSYYLATIGILAFLYFTLKG
jgi:undecaprenyl-diphosphatase